MSLIVGGSILFVVIGLIVAAIIKQPIAKTYAQHCVGVSESHRNINCLPKLLDHTPVINSIAKMAGKRTNVHVKVESTATWQKMLDSMKDNILKQIISQVVTPTDKIRVHTCDITTIDSQPRIVINNDNVPGELGIQVDDIKYKIVGKFVIPFNPPETTDKAVADEIMEQLMLDIPQAKEFKIDLCEPINSLAYGPFRRELFCRFEIVISVPSAISAAASLEYEWKYALGLPFAPIVIQSTSDASIHIQLPDVSEDTVSVDIATCEDVQPKKCSELSGLLCNMLCDDDIRNKLVESVKRNFIISFNRRPQSERSRIYTYSKDEINKIIESKFGRAKLWFTAGWAGIIGLIITGIILLFV